MDTWIRGIIADDPEGQGTVSFTAGLGDVQTRTGIFSVEEGTQLHCSCYFVRPYTLSIEVIVYVQTLIAIRMYDLFKLQGKKAGLDFDFEIFFKCSVWKAVQRCTAYVTERT